MQKSSLPAALHPLAQASPRQAGGLAFLPPPNSPPVSPHVPLAPPSVPAAGAAAPTAGDEDSVSSRTLLPVVQHPAAPPVNTRLPATAPPGSCHAAPRATGDRSGPRRGARGGGRGCHGTTSLQKVALLPKMGSGQGSGYPG